MKKSAIAFAFLTALSLTAAPVALAKNNGNKLVNVQFKKGSYSASYKGQVKGYNYNEYQFRAKAGQKLKVSLTGAGNLDALLVNNKLSDNIDLGTGSPDLNADGSYKLPYSGTYKVRVLQPRAGARNGKVQNYNLTISIR